MRTLLPLLALLGCTSAPRTDADPADEPLDDTADTDDTGDTGGLSDPECAPVDITAEVTDVTTVVRVRWRTETPTVGRVDFGKDEAYGLSAPPTEAGTEHEALLLGMTADTLVNFRVHTDGESCSAASGNQTVTTGSLPSGLFPTRATGTASWSGYQVLPLQGTGYAVVIVDNEGHYVWYHQVEASGNLMRAFLSADGKHVVLCHAGPQDALQNGKIVKVSLDGAEVTEIPFPYIDHDMVELPDGSIAAIVVDGQPEGTADKIVELRPDGTIVDVWSAWDTWDPDVLGIPEREHNWTHANALDYDPVADDYYISLKTMQTLAKIDRATGMLEWSMNGVANQFAFAGGVPVQMHHQFEVLDDTILFFENGNPDRGYSRAVEVRFDEEARTAEEIWSYTSDPPLYVFAKGDVHRFDDGITQVVWSSAGQIQNVSSEGEVVWQLDLDLGQAITFVQYVPSMYASQW
ncbi:MAG: aryl-sulfate sulfotransferase [Myxococcota bacterium]